MSKSSVTFGAVGDIAFGDHPLCAGFGADSTFKKHKPTFPFHHVKPVLDDCDLLFGNLECTLSQAHRSPRDHNSVQMRGRPDYVVGLADSGFDVLNLANNHALQHGEQAFRETVGLLSQHGIAATGVNFEDHLVGIPTVVEREGLSIAFLGYSLRPRQYFDQPPIYTEGHQDLILRDIKKIRGVVDIVIASVHWGEEFIQHPSPLEIQLGRQMVSAGADLVIGHHPHVMRGIEKYENGYIAYSLGNFVCDMLWDDSLRETGVFLCELSKGGVSNVRVVPCYINDEFQPFVLDADRAEDAHKKLDVLSRNIEAEDLSEFDAKHSTYTIDADHAQQAIRKKSHRFFLRRAFRYSPSILIQQIFRFIRNRLNELTHKEGPITK